MKFLEEFRDPELAKNLLTKIDEACKGSWTLMEVCGGQTHAIVRYGLDQLLPDKITLLHGPGCPVCVTPADAIDAAIDLSQQGIVITSFGDMLRVPGNGGDLLAAKAAGGDVRVVYSPLDAVDMAANEPEKEFVFFAVGFETTAPGNAMAVLEAKRRDLKNFALLVSHVLVPPAMEAILGGENKIDGFLAAGHVCTVMGVQEYDKIAAKFEIPIVVTGFEPVDILRGVLTCVEMLESHQSDCLNAYERAVADDGNPIARSVVDQVFEIGTRTWRGIGDLPMSGLIIREEWKDFDALKRFKIHPKDVQPSRCLAGKVLTGLIRPAECPEFGKGCTPESPMGAPMVSAEGACAAYYRYRGLK